ncbi:MAG: hypothetical protein H8D56_24550 [Planctomycetes bacterium]|nr:hypothetical protein [Planctomycetota bacterium]
MKVTINKVLKIFIGLFIAFTIGLALLYLTPHGKFFRLLMVHAQKDRQKKVRLLSETDHQALLEACREISREIFAGNLPPTRYLIRPEPVPEISLFPQLILDVEPMFIQTKSDGRVSVGMQGGWHHYGVTAYPEGFEKPSNSFKYGDKKIIDGLWYYEDGYNPRYNKWIEKMIQKGKKSNKVHQ